jgi:hypothetical protein
MATRTDPPHCVSCCKSQVLLRNSGDALPLSTRDHVYAAGRNADDIGNQDGGWTISWQGDSGANTPGTTILQGIREVAPKADVTYSAVASAPFNGAGVGVVVVAIPRTRRAMAMSGLRNAADARRRSRRRRSP